MQPPLPKATDSASLLPEIACSLCDEEFKRFMKQYSNDGTKALDIQMEIQIGKFTTLLASNERSTAREILHQARDLPAFKAIIKSLSRGDQDSKIPITKDQLNSLVERLMKISRFAMDSDPMPAISLVKWAARRANEADPNQQCLLVASWSIAEFATTPTENSHLFLSICADSDTGRRLSTVQEKSCQA